MCFIFHTAPLHFMEDKVHFDPSMQYTIYIASCMQTLMYVNRQIYVHTQHNYIANNNNYGVKRFDGGKLY